MKKTNKKKSDSGWTVQLYHPVSGWQNVERIYKIKSVAEMSRIFYQECGATAVRVKLVKW